MSCVVNRYLSEQPAEFEQLSSTVVFQCLSASGS